MINQMVHLNASLRAGESKKQLKISNQPMHTHISPSDFSYLLQKVVFENLWNRLHDAYL